MIDRADNLRLGRECGEVVSAELMIVIHHRVGEAANDGFGDV